MKNEFENFYPHAILNVYFNRMINRLGVRNETLKRQIFDEETLKELNKFSSLQIDRLKEVKLNNLNFLPPTFDENEYKQKWFLVLSENCLNSSQKIELIKEDLIHFDCVLLECTNRINGFDLWITPWFYNENDLEFLK